MYSFYGGKQGRTYHIVERFDLLYINYNDNQKYPPIDVSSKYSPGDIIKNEVGDKIYRVLPVSNPDEGTGYKPRLIDLSTDPDIIQLKGMVNEFQKGGAYTDVNYGQYVIIDSILNLHHKSDDTNGLLYRRGFDYTQGAASTERPDKTKSKYWNNGIFLEEKWLADWDKYIMNPGGGAIYVGQIVGPQGDSPRLVLEPLSTFSSHEHFLQPSTGSLDNTPGAIITNSSVTFNDTIKYGSALTADADSNIDGAHITFDIPYPVFDIDAVSVNPYNFSTDLSTAAQSTDEYRPQHYGAGVESPVQWRPNSGNNSLIHEFQYTSTSHPYFHDLQIAIPVGKHGTDVSTMGIHSSGGKQKIFYKTKNYFNNPGGEQSAAIDIADYNVISSVSTIPAERFVEEYRSEGEQIEIATGTIYIPYPNSSVQLIALTNGLVKTDELPEEDVLITLEGQVVFGIPEGEGIDPSDYAQLLVAKLPQPATAALQTSYTASSSSTVEFNNLDYLYITPQGKIYCVYTNLDSTSNNPTLLTQLKQIDNVGYHNGIDEDGTLTVNYNIGAPYTSYENNLVIGIDRKGDNIILLYSNINFRQKYLALDEESQQPLYEEGVDYYLIEYTEDMKEKYNLQVSNQDFKGDALMSSSSLENPKWGLVWVNFGPLGSQYHVFGHYTVQQVIDNIPNGFVGELEDRAGWIISVSQTAESNDKFLYAYDYANSDSIPSGDFIPGTRWYKLQDLTAATIYPQKSVYLGNDLQQTSLNQYGLAFITTMTHSHLGS